MTANSDAKIGGILLAAGGSSRFGQPKQLVEFDGKSLIRRAAEAITDSGCSPVIAVLGAEVERSAAELRDLNISVAINNDWPSGMSSSIRTGLEKLLGSAPYVDAVLITLCDQPYISGHDLSLLITEFRRSPVAMAASEYDGTVGVPAIFSKAVFPALLRLTGDKGARELLRSLHGVLRVASHKAAVDIDQPGDL